MQLPSVVERPPHLRPAGAEVAALTKPQLQAPPMASVVYDITPQTQVSAPKLPQTPAPELRRETLAALLLDQIHSACDASAKVVKMWFVNTPLPQQTQGQIQTLAQNRNHDPTATPGELAKEALTYSPGKTRKNERLG